MSGTQEGARKRLEKLREQHDPEWFRDNASKAGKASKRGGFASEKVGKDGLTGKQRASKNGKEFGHLSSTNFKNDPEKARNLSKKYWQKKGDGDDSNDAES